MKITKEMLDLAVSLNACFEGVARAKLGFECLTGEDKAWIARNPSTPASLLEVLSTDEDFRVRYYVAENPSTPVSLLEKLSTDNDSYIRRRVAYHPSTSVAILEKLSTDEDSRVRSYVAYNPTWISYKKTV